MNMRLLTLSAAASAILTAATPMVPGSMSTDNGGTKSAIDAYSDGGGVVIINQAGDTKFDNSAMNGLVFKYGQTAEDSGTTLKNQVSVLSADTTAAEKAISVKFDLAKVVINPPVNGTTCDDGNPQTITDLWNNSLCGGTNIEGNPCNDDDIQTIDDKFHNGVCAGTNVEGVACDDSVGHTYNDRYASGVCAGTIAISCKNIKDLTPIVSSGVYSIKPTTSSGAFNVYCDMTTDGGGWTYLQGGRISSETTDQDFFDYYAQSDKPFVSLSKPYSLLWSNRNLISFKEFRSIHSGETNHYENNVVLAAQVNTSLTGGVLSTIPIVSYTVKNTINGNSNAYNISACHFTSAYTGHIDCSGGTETQNPWYQANKISFFNDRGVPEYGVHTCTRFIKQNGTTISTCGEHDISAALYAPGCDGGATYAWDNRIVSPFCDYRTKSGVFYRWEEWVR